MPEWCQGSYWITHKCKGLQHLLDWHDAYIDPLTVLVVQFQSVVLTELNFQCMFTNGSKPRCTLIGFARVFIYWLWFVPQTCIHDLGLRFYINLCQVFHLSRMRGICIHPHVLTSMHIQFAIHVYQPLVQIMLCLYVKQWNERPYSR